MSAYGHLFENVGTLQSWYEDLKREEKGVAAFYMEYIATDTEGGGNFMDFFSEEDLQPSEQECIQQLSGILRRTCDDILRISTSLEMVSRSHMDGEDIAIFLDFVAPGNLHEANAAIGHRRVELKPVREAMFRGGVGFEATTGRQLGQTDVGSVGKQRHVSYSQLSKIDSKVSTTKAKLDAAAVIFTDMMADKSGGIQPMNTAYITECLSKVTEALGWGTNLDVNRVVRRGFNSFLTAEKGNGSGGMSMPDMLDDKQETTSDMLKMPSFTDKEESNMGHCRELYRTAEAYSESHTNLLPPEDAARDAEIAYLWNTMNMTVSKVMCLALTMSSGLSKRLKGTRLVTKVTELAATVTNMIDQERENVNVKRHYGLYFTDWETLTPEKLAIVIQLSASSLALGVFGEIMVGLNHLSAGNVKIEISNLVTDFRLLSLMRNHTMHTVTSNMALQIRAINKDHRNNERVFSNTRLLQLGLENFTVSHVKELTERADYTEIKELMIEPIEEFNDMQVEWNGKVYKITQVDRLLGMLLEDKQGGGGLPWEMWENPAETISAMKASNPNCLKDIDYLRDIARRGHESSKFKVEATGTQGPVPKIRGETPGDSAARATTASSVANLAAGFSLGDNQASPSSSKSKAKANAAEGHSGTPTKTEPSGPFSVGAKGYDDKSRSKARSKFATMTPKDLYNFVTTDSVYTGPPILAKFFSTHKGTGQVIKTDVGSPMIKVQEWANQRDLPEEERLIRDHECTPANWYLLWRARQLQRFYTTKNGTACVTLEHDPDDAANISDANYVSFKASFTSSKYAARSKARNANTNSNTKPTTAPTANLSVDDIEAAAKKEADRLEFEEKVKTRGKELFEERQGARAGSSSDGQSQATITERSGGGGV